MLRSFEQVRGMTRLQALHILFHPRDDKGALIPYGTGKKLARPLSDRDRFGRRWARVGLHEYQIEALWQEALARRPQPQARRRR